MLSIPFYDVFFQDLLSTMNLFHGIFFKMEDVHSKTKKTSHPGKGTFSIAACCSLSPYISEFLICPHKLIQVSTFKSGHRIRGGYTCCTVPRLLLLRWDVVFWMGSSSNFVSPQQGVWPNTVQQRGELMSQ